MQRWELHGFISSGNRHGLCCNEHYRKAILVCDKSLFLVLLQGPTNSKSKSSIQAGLRLEAVGNLDPAAGSEQALDSGNKPIQVRPESSFSETLVFRVCAQYFSPVQYEAYADQSLESYWIHVHSG